MNDLYIIGAGGQGRVISDVARAVGYEKIFFLDDAAAGSTVCGIEVVGKVSALCDLDGDFFVAIGNNDIRRKIMDFLNERGKNIVTLIHPSAVISPCTKIGEGSVVLANAVVNNSAAIGRGCIINTASSVDHDCRVGDFVHISPGARLSGTVTVGEHSWCGTGSVIINNVSVCERCIIGAGAVVIRDITESGTYVGNPVRKVH